jgi:hypothetical protein
MAPPSESSDPSPVFPAGRTSTMTMTSGAFAVIAA